MKHIVFPVRRGMGTNRDPALRQRFCRGICGKNDLRKHKTIFYFCNPDICFKFGPWICCGATYRYCCWDRSYCFYICRYLYFGIKSKIQQNPRRRLTAGAIKRGTAFLRPPSIGLVLWRVCLSPHLLLTLLRRCVATLKSPPQRTTLFYLDYTLFILICKVFLCSEDIF